MKLLLVNQSRDRAPEAWLRRWVKALARALKREVKGARVKEIGRRELVIVLVTSAEMRRMNHLYRGKNYATDVLSFESADPDCIGELLICPPVVRAQAKRTGLSERGELGFMTVHGVLHLLGYDHETSKKDEAKMFALQDRLYAVLEKSVGLS